MRIAVKIRECRLANEDHVKARRQYAHVGHHKGTICIARAFWELPGEHFFGILAHEIGHLISPDDGEDEANEAMFEQFRIKVKYKDSRWGENLEYLGPKDMERFKKLFVAH